MQMPRDELGELQPQPFHLPQCLLIDDDMVSRDNGALDLLRFSVPRPGL